MSEPVPWPDHVGERIVVRTRTDRGLVDVLGDLLSADDGRLLVLTRRGEVEVDVTSITAGHPVPPAPSRPAPPHRALSVSDLELVAADHWRAPDTDWLGGWLLRAADGFTRRANSVLAVGEPGMPMHNALDEVTDWYDDRGQRPIAASPEPGLDDGDTEQLLAATGAFERAGWQPIPSGSAMAMTAPVGELRAPVGVPAGLTLTLAGEPDAAWLDAYFERQRPYSAMARTLLTSAREQVFASVLDGGRAVAVARCSLARRWAGLGAVEVDPQHRRQGLARAMTAAAAQWAWSRGAGSAFVQVVRANEAGRKLWERSGFEEHHRYEYLTPADG